MGCIARKGAAMMRIKNWKQFQHYTRRNPPWIRLYRTLLDDREWFALDGDAGKMLIMCWLVASDDDGNLPSAADLAFRFRMTEKQVNAALSKLSHWLEHDASTPLADCLHDATPEQSRAEAETEQRERGADAPPRDIRGDLFGKGLTTLAEITGKTPDSCRSLVGKWLKSVNDEAIHVLAAIDEAERNRVADPVAWINKSLQSHMGNRNGKRTVHDAADEQLARLRALNEPGPAGLRDGTGESPIRLLPAR
jgi:hypothetical protein